MILLLKPTIIVTPDEVLKNTGIYIDTTTGKVLSLSQNYNIQHDFEVNFPVDTVAFPALINAHDHLVGSYWPKVGPGPHENWKGWDDAWKASTIFQERAQVNNADLYMLGAYKNILSGVTTVMDHVPHKVNEEILPQLPIRTIQHYGLAHEVSSFDLKWGDGVAIEHRRSVEHNWPFITHIEEGFDEESMRGVDNLLEENALDDHTVMIHGIALSHSDIYQIALAGGHLIWCPESNDFMFNVVADVGGWLTAGVNTSLATDSTITGSLNLQHEMAAAMSLFMKKYGYALDDRELTMMVTKNPAKALRLDHKLGEIKPDYLADILVMRLQDRNNPYTSLTHSSFNDIEILFKEGLPLYGYTDYDLLFKKLQPNNFTSENICSKDRLIVGNLGRVIRTVWTALGFKKELPFIPIK